MGILGWIIVGLLAGLLARAIVPGRQSMSLWMTLLLGLGGSLVGGLLGTLFTGGGVTAFEPAGIIGSVLGAIALLLIAGAVMSRRGHARAPA
jgi:uncharacterized membrane protein YeaQ/YmgE (transglycosylase-associated protein family)